MARQYYCNGETMVYINGSQLGLANAPISIAVNFVHLDIAVDCWGGEMGRVVPEVQTMLSDAVISMTLVHFDPTVLEGFVQNSMGGSPSIGALPRTGTLMAANGFFSNMTLSSPVAQFPWTFPSVYLTQQPMTWPLGTERSLVSLTVRALATPVGGDPYQGGTGSRGAVLWNFAGSPT